MIIITVRTNDENIICFFYCFILQINSYIELKQRVKSKQAVLLFSLKIIKNDVFHVKVLIMNVIYNKNIIVNFKIVNKIDHFSRESVLYRYKNYNVNDLSN